MITTSKSFIHWNYFLALESDLENVSRYIEFIDANFDTYSIELAHLLLASSSECDVVLKELCALLSPNERGRKDINFYRSVIKSNLPEFINEPIFINHYNISVKPWDNWNGDNNPYWWTSYNHVKHKRSQCFKEASLRHTISSIGGLLIVCFYYYKKLFEKESKKVMRSTKVTEILQQRSNFMQLSPSFYHNYVYDDKL
jgi:hypothetical protein